MGHGAARPTSGSSERGREGHDWNPQDSFILQSLSGKSPKAPFPSKRLPGRAASSFLSLLPRQMLSPSTSPVPHPHPPPSAPIPLPSPLATLPHLPPANSPPQKAP